MKKLFFLTLIFCVAKSATMFAQVGIGTTSVDSSAAFEIKSNNRGFLPPRMTTNQMDAIRNPVDGLVLYNTTIGNLMIRSGGIWVPMPRTAACPCPPAPGSICMFNKIYPSIDEWNQLFSTTTTSDGGYVGVSNIGNLPTRILLRKFDNCGVPVWSVTLEFDASTIGDVRNVIEAANGDIIVTSYMQSIYSASGNHDISITRVSAAGVILWSKEFTGGGAGVGEPKVAELSTGEIVFACSTSASASGQITGTTHGGYDIWVAKINSTGTTILAQALLGGSGNEGKPFIRKTTTGGIVLCCESTSSASGNVLQTNRGSGDIWIANLSATLAITNSILIGGAGSETNPKITPTTGTYAGFTVTCTSTSSSSFSVASVNHGGTDIWVANLPTTLGSITWQRLFGGTGNEVSGNIEQTADAGFITCGSTTSSANGDISNTLKGIKDALVLKLYAAGTKHWDKEYGSSRNDEFYTVKQLPDNSFTCFGQSQGDDFDIVDPNPQYALPDYFYFRIWGLRLDIYGNK